MSGEAPRSVIVWTLRRTGGTSVERAFATVFGKSAVLPEAFNFDRQLGDISRALNASGDRVAASAALAERLNRPTMIKHCVEMASRDLNRTLLAHAVLHRLHSIVLYRDDEAARLRSLAIALSFDLWGTGSPDWWMREALAGRFSPASVDAAYLRHVAEFGANEMSFVRRALLAMAVPFQEVTTESLYGDDAAVAAARLGAMLRAAGIPANRVDEAALLGIARTGNQNSRKLWKLVPRHEELLATIEATPTGRAFGAYLRRPVA